MIVSIFGFINSPSKNFKSFFLLTSLVLLNFPATFGQEVLSLNGTWEIIFDENNLGRRNNWMNSEIFDSKKQIEKIQVPSAWELIKKDYEGVAFYRKSFIVPNDWEGKIINIQFDAVNYLSEIWINDQAVGYHEGGFTPFEFRVDGMIKVGEANDLIIRVVGPLILSDKEIDGVKAMQTPQWRGGINGGIWQPVRLVTSGDIYLQDVFLQTNLSEASVSFETSIEQSSINSQSCNIEITIYQGNKVIKGIEQDFILRPGTISKKWKLNVPSPSLWSPRFPNLYTAKVIVKQSGIVSDHWETNFGFRDFTIKDQDFYLNGERIYIKATFFEGLYPNGIAFPDSEEMIRKEIQLAKDAGFNMIRPWRHPPPQIWLNLADEMGILVVGSPALECMTLPIATPYLSNQVENEIRESILRDRNRTCIVQWELFNELHRPVLKQLMRPMALLARNLDPTRLILDESGGWAFGANMYLPTEYEPMKFNDIHNYPGPFINKEQYDGYLSIGLTDQQKKFKGFSGSTPGKNVMPNLMSFVSELGYGSLPDLTINNKLFKEDGNSLTPAYRYHKRIHRQQKQVIFESGFNEMYPNMQKFYLDQQAIHGNSNKRMIEAVRSNPNIKGYCIHALIAGDWILGAGLIDLWRNPKNDVYQRTKEGNESRILSIRTFPRNVFSDDMTNIQLVGINDLNSIRGQLTLQVLDENGNIVLSKTESQDFKSGIHELLNKKISTDNLEGKYQINAFIKNSDEMILAQNTHSFNVFKARNYNAVKLALFGPSGKLNSFLSKNEISYSKFSMKTSKETTVVVLKTDDNYLAAFDNEELLQFVKRGGRIIFLEPVSKEDIKEGNKFGIDADVHPAKGLWTCIPHLIKEHPFFKGVPSGIMMNDTYENIWPTNTLRNLEIDGVTSINPIVASIGFDWFSPTHKMHYSGPGDSWWGSDMVTVKLGQGRIIFSQFRILENMSDPLSAIIFYNLIMSSNSSN